MNPEITTLPPSPNRSQTKQAGSYNGIECSILTLAPRDELSAAEHLLPHEHILFVVQGSVTARVDKLNYVLTQDETMHIPANKEYKIWNQGSDWAKVLRVDVPPRVPASLPIVTFEG